MTKAEAMATGVCQSFCNAYGEYKGGGRCFSIPQSEEECPRPIQDPGHFARLLELARLPEKERRPAYLAYLETRGCDVHS